jgi:O-antigen/teichoic acid export membrane protein
MVSEAFRLAFLRVDKGDHRYRRFAGILQGFVTGLGNRLIGVLVGFLSVPLTIGYLGPERYGIWVAIGTLLAWLQVADLGLGNTLKNALTSAIAQGRMDLARAHLSTAIIGFAVAALAAGFIGLLVWPWIDWAAVFGARTSLARSEIAPAVAIAMGAALVNLPLSVTGSVYIAYQEGRIGNYWAMLGNIANLVALLIVTRTEAGLVWLVVALAATSLAINIVAVIWLFRYHKPELSPRLECVNAYSFRQLAHIGGLFFLITIISLVTFQTDNLVIAHYLGSDQVPQYSLTYRLFEYASVFQTILFSYLWGGYTEAISRKDINWVRRTFNLNLGGSVGFSLVAATALVFAAQPFICWWAGDAAVPSRNLVLWIALWSVINAFTSPVACLLAAASRLRNQTIYSAFGAAGNIILTLTLVKSWGITGVIAGTVISYLVCICVPCIIDARLLLRKLSRDL